MGYYTCMHESLVGMRNSAGLSKAKYTSGLIYDFGVSVGYTP